jgi:hypothetical protein
MENEIDQEDKELEETLSQAIRPAKLSDFEQLLASNLAAAIFSPPLQKIRMVLEGWLLLPEEEAIKLIPNEEERKDLERIYEVAISLENVFEIKKPYNYERLAIVPWSFSLDDAFLYLRLFIKRYWAILPKDFSKDFEKMNEEEKKVTWYLYLNKLAAFLNSGYASLNLIKMIENEFITTIMPKALELLRLIHTKFISQETWEHTLSIMSGKMKSEKT